ncbi:MAG: Efflux ABC transporter, permease/ATP-binding protein [uncultured Sphingosinicella sp.]|uniref:Efflux ABC transporter, permease/ATP-binding protein n=1 Tax=uncultured Sphingosinicella sp. TaxID=478748 RepID=A0A6J4TB01_9SPHN|nr:ABC transporter transmembrane domain-containing protein [uncultured Sphingosinicella sp.]CAA9517950.1 MAG: Efflux ABC transporter, permease/ATP-binding protein [uncultured Sphingosinicella sp.]
MADSSADAPPSKKLGNLGIIWRHAVRYPGKIAAAALALLVAAAATLAIPDGFRRVIDKGFAANGGDVSEHFTYLFFIVMVLALATAVRFFFVSWLGERVVADIRTAVHRNLLRLEPRFFEENRPSEISSRLTSDTSVIEMVVGQTVSVALRNIVMGIGGIVYLFTLAPKLTAFLLLGIPLVIAPVVFLGRKLRDVSRYSQDRVADVGAIVSETLGAMKIVQAFGQEPRESERFSSAVEDAFGTARRRIRLRAVMTAIIISIVFGSITVVMWQAALDVAAGRLTGGTVAAFVFTGAIVAGAFGALTEVYGELLRGAGAAGRLAELLAEVPEIKAPANPVRLPDPAQGALSFEHVHFRYPTRPEVSALADFSLQVRPGETVAVVGPSGAGKTTLFQLAQRFYDPEEGVVRLDGIDLRAADPADIRARIAVVPQETVIFAASARDNLRYGRWDANDDALWKAAEAANAAEFLRKLPQGLDTFMGEGGARLSGGQRQRIAIARAILRDAPLLLLDEATSALDAESERLVQAALERLVVDRTTIVIAHRLATVRTADRIVVMDQGRIVEEGTHESLQARGGLYARLARLQFEGLAA